jgi:hypothetical protein
MIRKLLTGLALLTLTAAVPAAPPPSPQETWTRSALERLPVARADKTPERLELRAEQSDAFAREIAKVSASAPLPPRQWAALILAIGHHESAFDTDIVANRCKPWACDRGRARGAFQNHRVSFVAELWDVAPGNVEAQVAMVDRALRRSLARCKPFAPFPAHVFRAYAGRSCSFELKGEQARVATYLRVVSR